MYLVWINPPIKITFSDDSIFLKKNLGGGHKFSEFACFLFVSFVSTCLVQYSGSVTAFTICNVNEYIRKQRGKK